MSELVEKNNVHALNRIHVCLSAHRLNLIEKAKAKGVPENQDNDLHRVNKALEWVFSHSIAIVNAEENPNREGND